MRHFWCKISLKLLDLPYWLVQTCETPTRKTKQKEQAKAPIRLFDLEKTERAGVVGDVIIA